MVHYSPCVKWLKLVDVIRFGVAVKRGNRCLFSSSRTSHNKDAIWQFLLSNQHFEQRFLAMLSVLLCLNKNGGGGGVVILKDPQVPLYVTVGFDWKLSVLLNPSPAAPQIYSPHMTVASTPSGHRKWRKCLQNNKKQIKCLSQKHVFWLFHLWHFEESSWAAP